MEMLKKISLPVLMLLGVLSSCGKESDEISPLAATDRDANARPVGTTLLLDFNPEPALVGQSATVTATINPIPGEGEMQLQRALDDAGDYTTVALATDWETVKQEEISTSGMISYTYTPDAAGMYGFRARYVPKGGSGYAANHTTADLEVIQPCIGRLNLVAAVDKITPLGDNRYQFEVIYTVTACETFTDVKLQGGLTAFSTLVGATPTASNVREQHNNNYVINWIETSIGSGFNKTYRVTFEKELSGAGTHTITGDWSVKAMDAQGLEVVAGYNNALSVTIE